MGCLVLLYMSKFVDFQNDIVQTSGGSMAIPRSILEDLLRVILPPLLRSIWATRVGPTRKVTVLTVQNLLVLPLQLPGLLHRVLARGGESVSNPLMTILSRGRMFDQKSSTMFKFPKIDFKQREGKQCSRTQLMSAFSCEDIGNTKSDQRSTPQEAA